MSRRSGPGGSEQPGRRRLLATVRVLERSVVRTARSLHGPLFLAGVAITLVQAAVLIALTALVSTFLSGLLATVGSLLSIAALIVTLPLYVSLYVAVDEGVRGVRETLRTATGAIRTHYRRVLVADLIALSVALVGGTIAVAGWYAFDTAARYFWPLLTAAGPFPSTLSVRTIVPAFLAGFLVTGLVVRFADAFVLFEDAAPPSAWRWSLRFVRAKPPIFVGYVVVVVATTAATTAWAPVVPDGSLLLSSLLTLALTIATGTVSVTVAGTFHATFFREAVEPSVGAVASQDPPAAIDRTRILVALVVLLAAILASGVVRANGPQIGDDESTVRVAPVAGDDVFPSPTSEREDLHVPAASATFGLGITGHANDGPVTGALGILDL